MSDNGLLLNFTTSQTPKQLMPKQLAALQGANPKKGSWRDRRDAKRAQYNPETDSAESKPRIPHGGISKTPMPHSTGSGSSKKNRGSSICPSEGSQGGIVSSLFTYNPEIERRTEQCETTDKKSTNAPLSNSFSFAVNPTLQKYLNEKMGFQTPTQIQSTAISAITDATKFHKDVVMVAQTGSGKTLAYLLPILSMLMTRHQRIDRASGVFAVILAPTRELATQIFQVCEELCRCCHYIVPGLVIGGEKKKSEKARLRKGVNILIGTPGRMADHTDNTMRLTFNKTEFVVLDEGDRLIDLGFEETLTQILTKIPKTRTTVLCSATMNTQASRLKTLALSEPVEWVREVKPSLEQLAPIELTPGQLVQKLSIVPAKLRLVTLVAKLKGVRMRSKRAVVFFSCTDSVDFHFHVLNKYQPAPAPLFRLHGGMTQLQRTETLSQFLKSGTGGILLTTDVASRGLDATLDEVIEYDPPFSIEDHLHRAGRTARAGRKGESLLFLLPSEQSYEEKIRAAHNGNIKSETYQSLLQRGFGFSEWQYAATLWQLKIEKAVVNDTDGLAELARKAFTGHVRAYTTHSHAEKAVFNFKGLHLGHLAKAFALRETPKSITGGSSGNNSSGHSKKKQTPRQAMLDAAQRQMDSNEYNVM